MLVIPVGNDQPRVAQQIEDLHLGKYLKRKTLTPTILKDNAKEILQSMSYKESIMPFQKKSAGGRRECCNRGDDFNGAKSHSGSMKHEQWILCPVCGCKTRLKIREDTVLENFPAVLSEMQA